MSEALTNAPVPGVVAAVGDVHANLPALRAVLADTRRRVDAIWNCGDAVGYGAFPDQCVRLLRRAARVSILGNYDEKVLRLASAPGAQPKTKDHAKRLAFRWTCEHLSAPARQWLAGLPHHARLTVGGRRVLIVHGSPDSDSEGLTDDTPRQRLAELAAAADADVILSGHAHVPARRRVAGVLFVNTGSVGRPEGGDPRACYAVLRFGPAGVRVSHRRVEYDVEAAAGAIRRAGLPDAFAQIVRQGRNLDDLRNKKGGPEDGHPLRREPVLAAVNDLRRRCHDEQGHSDQVTRLALALFDATRDLHGQGDDERFWLECAGLLHDVGLMDGRGGHHKASMRLILADDELPLPARVRRIVASIARYHRKALPADRHRNFAELAEVDRRPVCILAAILRIADGLDRTHTAAVESLSCRIGDADVTIGVKALGLIEAELAAAARKADLFERAFSRRVRFDATGA